MRNTHILGNKHTRSSEMVVMKLNIIYGASGRYTHSNSNMLAVIEMKTTKEKNENENEMLSRVR